MHGSATHYPYLQQASSFGRLGRPLEGSSRLQPYQSTAAYHIIGFADHLHSAQIRADGIRVVAAATSYSLELNAFAKAGTFGISRHLLEVRTT